MIYLKEHIFYNLTKPQESIWFSDQFSNVPANNIMGTMFFKKDIDIALLKEAISLTVKNNEALRTKLVMKKEETILKQYFDDTLEFDIPVIDLSSDSMDKFKQLQKEFSAEKFNLLGNYLFHFLIVILPNDEIAFIGKFHHIIADAWSLGLFIDNVAVNYTKLAKKGIDYSLVSGNYTDFIKRESSYLTSNTYLENQNFWVNKLKNVEPISLKTNLKNSYIAKRSVFSIDKNTSVKLGDFCKTQKISPYTLFLAALQIYLYRFTSQSDFSLASPILNRTGKEKSVMGMFVNMISFYMHTEPDMTVLELLNTLSKEVFSCLKNSKYPYMDLLNDLKKFDSSNSYNIVFSFQNMRPKNTIKNLVKYRIEWDFSGYSYDQLAINVTDLNNDGTYSLEYDYLVDLFSAEEISYMHSRIFTILQNIIQNPNVKISDISILSKEEEQKVLTYSAGKKLEYDKSETIVKLFEQAVENYPNQKALVHKDISLIYSDLSNMVNVIANSISSKEIYNSRIAVMCRKSIYMVAALLGVMKSGNCYIPIDPEYPNDRIEYIMENSDCKLLITTTDLKDKFSNKPNIILDDLDFNSKINFADKSLPDMLAYMIYTSGTTGKPKGVKIKHKNIVNTLIWRKNYYQFSPKDAVIQIPSFSFDSSVEDIFTPLISGSTLVMPTSSKLDINSISEDILNNKITHFLVVPSLYKVLLNEKADCLQYLNIITIAGESFPMALIKEHFHKLPHVRIVNEYGPTENSVCSTYYEMKHTDNTIYIGRAIDNCYTYCLDANLNLLPLGSEGELYVSGPGVAEGYFKKEELTKERFMPNPFVPGLSMYKTGDIVKLHTNGLLEFIGRKDKQVKLHGFRIELKEIEEVLLENKEIKDATVTIKKVSENKDMLIAYITSNENVNLEKIYAHLRDKLPYYMVPTIMKMDKFPLTPNGKIDFNKLPIPSVEKKVSTSPKNELEAKFLKICQEVIHNDNFGVEDDFFIDGTADSLNILSISSKLFSQNVNVDTQYFYKYPSIRQLCEFLSSKEYLNNTTKKEFVEPIKNTIPENLTESMLNFTYKNVLLTGVTGFFGVHTLYQLLHHTKCNVYCLVREKQNKTSLDRLINKLNYYFGSDFYTKYQDRIIVITGELSYDNFGLSANDYDKLQKTIDCIINTAAITKHYGSSNVFYKENIKTVQNLIAFCKNTNIVLNQISTTTVSGNFLVSNDLKCDFTENDFYIGQNYEDNMYVYSKFEAERLVLEEEKNGLRANIFRLGNLMARYSDGQFQKNKFDNAYYCRLLALAKLGYLPNNLAEQMLEFTPIDDASLAVVRLLSIPDLNNKIFHVFTDKLIPIQLLLRILSDMNVSCKFIDYDAFMRKLHEKENEGSLALIVSDIGKNNEINYESGIHVKHEITNKYLEKIGFSWHTIDENYLKRFFEKVNFLKDIK